MPTYLYRCANQHITTKICPVSCYEEAVTCDDCDLVAQRLFTAPILVAAQAEVRYDSPIDGTPITSRYAREEDMKRHNCIEYDPEMKRDADRKREESQRQLEAAVEQTVTEAIAKMPTAKRAKLYSEVVEQGVGCEVIRS